MTIEQIANHLQKILTANRIKEGSKKASDMEYAYLHGIIATCEANNIQPHPIVGVCLVSGRSILSMAVNKLPAVA